MKFIKRKIYQKDHILPSMTKERLIVYVLLTGVLVMMMILGIGDSKLYRTSLITADQQKILVESARSRIGTPYVLGADSPPTNPRQYDCSSLMVDVYDEININLPRVSKDQYKVGKSITQSDALPGDLIFFDTFNAGRVTHVGIITKKEKDGTLWMVDANSQVEKVVEEKLSGKYWRNAFEGVKRVNEFTKDIVEEIDDQGTNEPVTPLPPSELDDPRVIEAVEGNTSSDNNSIATSINTNFNDVNASYPYKKAIENLAKQNVISGIGDNNFGPYMYLTRAELLKLSFKINKMSMISKATNLYDVKGHWVEKYVKTAVAKGYVKGYDDNTFKPNSTVSRAEAAKIIFEITGKKNKFNGYENFSDISDDDWVSKYASIIKENRMLNLNGISFEPNKGLTRGEAANLIYQISRL